MTQIDDHTLLLMGVSDGYPLPSQHPARQLLEEGRFEFALAVAGIRDTLRVTNGSKLSLTETGRRWLMDHALSVNDRVPPAQEGAK